MEMRLRERLGPTLICIFCLTLVFLSGARAGVPSFHPRPSSSTTMSRSSAARRLAASLLGQAQAGAGGSATADAASASRGFASKTGGGGVRPGEPSPTIKAAAGPKGVINVSKEREGQWRGRAPRRTRARARKRVDSPAPDPLARPAATPPCPTTHSRVSFRAGQHLAGYRARLE